MMAVAVFPVKSGVPAALLRDGDVIRWEDNVALVRVTGGTVTQDAGQVFVRQLPHQSLMFGYTNRLHTWDELQTPIYEIRPREQVELLLVNGRGNV